MPPSTIKNYRDELDPYFPNGRKGWHQRPLRRHCSDVLEKFGDASLDKLARLVKSFFDPNWDLDDVDDDKRGSSEMPLEESPFAKRLVTGRAAEGFFRLNYRAQEELASGTLIDTTLLGCGFDFRINFEGPRDFYAIEVKGMFNDKGGLLLTEKEFHLANKLKDRYFLYVVRNFRESPYASVWRNPLNTEIDWELREEQITVSSWRTFI